MEKNRTENYLRMIKAIENDMAEYNSYDTAAAFSRVRKKIKATQRKQFALACIRRIAAVLLIPLLASTVTLAYLYMKQMREDAVYCTLTSAPGIVTRVKLPDDSDVWLNAGSKLRYPWRFTGKERNVYLEGEAYFHVESDAGNPFYVNLNRDMRVKAYGTRFNVCSYPEDPFTEIVLESGAVDVALGKQTWPLHPNGMMSFDTTTRKLAVQKVRADEKTAWIDGRLLFRNTPIREVVRKLARHYNVDIELQGDTSKTHHLRATFTTETISQALDYMSMATPLEWSSTPMRQQDNFSYARRKITIVLK